MKNRLILIYSAFLLLAVFCSSCEKGLDQITVDSIVYLTQYGTSEQTALLGESKINLGVYRSGINQTEGDLKVTLDVDQDTLTSFLTANPTYTLLPETYYSIPSNTVTIPDGEEVEYFKIQLKNIDENFVDKLYVLPISIKSVDSEVEVKSDQKVVFFLFKRYRNLYEAKYYANGTIVGATSGTSTTIDESLSATSVNANTIKVEGPETGMYLNLAINDGEVKITDASTSQSYNIHNTSGTTSTYTGKYNDTYKCNEGNFNLYYTYTLAGEEKNVSVVLKFWL